MKKLLIAITLIISVFLLVACSQPKVRQLTPDENLTALLAEFKEESCHITKGKILKNNVLYAEIEAKTDYKNKKIDLNFNGTEYLYYAKYLLKNEKDCTVEKGDTSYAETLENYLPFSIASFVYSPNNRGEIYKTDDITVITFLNKGVKNSFSSPLDIYGGVLTVTSKNGKITESTLTTTLTEKGVSYPLYVHYEYQTTDKVFDEAPWVAPTDSLYYATYVLSAIYDAYPGATLKTYSSKTETGTSIKALPIDSSIVSSVTTKTGLGGGLTNLTINYSAKQIIFGLGSNVETFQVIYDKNYNVNLVIVGSVQYVLE